MVMSQYNLIYVIKFLISKAYLNYIGLESIKNIEKFSNTLQILNLSNNEISNIHPISHLKLLIELNLSSNYM
jgi:Leucine-rich repeat (LRR) protein